MCHTKSAEKQKGALFSIAKVTKDCQKGLKNHFNLLS
jgi:hypothetical protein